MSDAKNYNLMIQFFQQLNCLTEMADFRKTFSLENAQDQSIKTSGATLLTSSTQK